VQKFQDLPDHLSEAVKNVVGEGEVVKAARIVVGKHIFFSKHYSRMMKRNPCVVQFQDDTIGEIESFAWNMASGKVVAIYKQLLIDNEKPFFFNNAGHHVIRVQNEMYVKCMTQAQRIGLDGLKIINSLQSPCSQL